MSSITKMNSETTSLAPMTAPPAATGKVIKDTTRFKRVQNAVQIAFAALEVSFSANSLTLIAEYFCEEIYIGKRANDRDLSFVMVRLTEDTLNIWWDLHKRGQYVLRHAIEQFWNDNWTRQQKKLILSDVEGGAMAFRSTLLQYEMSRGTAYQPEVWISYALSGNVDPTDPMNDTLFPHVEMVLTALTHSDVPIVTHFGIGRTIYNLKKIYDQTLPQHKNLSIPLQAFTAQAIRLTLQGHHKVWMITCPTFNMADIFDRCLLSTQYVKEWKNLPVIRSEENVRVISPQGQELARYSTDEFFKGKMAFYHHANMCLTTPYAVQYQALGDLF